MVEPVRGPGVGPEVVQRKALMPAAAVGNPGDVAVTVGVMSDEVGDGKDGCGGTSS